MASSTAVITVEVDRDAIDRLTVQAQALRDLITRLEVTVSVLTASLPPAPPIKAGMPLGGALRTLDGKLDTLLAQYAPKERS